MDRLGLVVISIHGISTIVSLYQPELEGPISILVRVLERKQNNSQETHLVMSSMKGRLQPSTVFGASLFILVWFTDHATKGGISL